MLQVSEELPPLLMIGDNFSYKLKLFIFEIVFSFIYLWPCWVSVAARAPFSRCGARGLLIAVASPEAQLQGA